MHICHVVAWEGNIESIVMQDPEPAESENLGMRGNFSRENIENVFPEDVIRWRTS